MPVRFDTTPHGCDQCCENELSLLGNPVRVGLSIEPKMTRKHEPFRRSPWFDGDEIVANAEGSVGK